MGRMEQGDPGDVTSRSCDHLDRFRSHVASTVPQRLRPMSPILPLEPCGSLGFPLHLSTHMQRKNEKTFTLLETFYFLQSNFGKCSSLYPLHFSLSSGVVHHKHTTTFQCTYHWAIHEDGRNPLCLRCY